MGRRTEASALLFQRYLTVIVFWHSSSPGSEAELVPLLRGHRELEAGLGAPGLLLGSLD